MDYAKKMVVVPQELLSRVSGSQAASQSDSTIDGDLDSEMRRILEDKSTSDSDKWKLYQQVLRRYLHVAAARREPFNLPIVEEKTPVNVVDSTMEDIVQSLPQAYHTETRALLRTLSRRPDLIKWDGDYTVHTNNQRIPGSNIIDIVHSIVRARKTANLPPGWEQVMNVLKDMNVPIAYVSNPAALEFLGYDQPDTILSRSRRSLFVMPDTPSQTPSPQHERLINVPYSNRRAHWRTSPYGRRNATTSSPSGWEPF